MRAAPGRTSGAVAAVLAVCAMAGCAGSPDAPDPVPASPAPDALVLRRHLSGGIGGIGLHGSVPDLSVYGDGRVIAVREDGARHEPLPRLQEYRLTPRALRRLIDDAFAAGLAEPRRVRRENVADAFTLTVRFGSAVTTIEHPGDDDPAVRFAERRLAPERWPRQDLAAPPGPYRVERLAALFHPQADDPGNVRRWPFTPPGTQERPCLVLQGRDAARALRIAEDTDGRTAWGDGGRAYTVRWRPLLPGEDGCADVTGP
ncbi:hypothetical protein [Thermomonospora cellulosilytica]|uniref:Lipoprotein n=1 Tax=Thermomonospora cellulosilytica TaxID=1411118 RepID=A0A7W3N4P4_9ACTN|nr:hypothetical protein [Thermomonospora cellulosilytica]MBA9007475.1 hypothetical protein [Thermomonospora cellulosilytica]